VPGSRRQATPAERLSRYREALVHGAPPEELERLARGLDPDLVATVRWSLMTGRQARPQPDPHFVRELRRELVTAVPGSATQTPRHPAAPVVLNGRHTAPPSLRPHPVREELPDSPVTHSRWTWGSLAAAAVLALLLVGSVLLVRQVTVERPQTQLGAIGEPTTETLLDATLTGAAETWTPLAVERWRFQPDATLTIPSVDGPQWIVADISSIVVSLDGASQSLAPGQSVVIPAGQELSVRNAGLAETAVYRGVAALGFSLEEYDRSLVTREVALDTEAHESLPPGPSHVIFDRLSIPAGTTLRADAATGQDWFTIDTGQLGLTLVGDALPQAWSSGQERELTTDDSIPVLVPGTHITLRNVGDDPLVLLRLRISPQAQAQAPASN
jgi:hypothetical protein